MQQIRKSDDRGFANHGWLKSRHTFSFADYYDPKHMGFRNLRVINEDRIQGGTGFGSHPHKDMEIISYVVSGSLEHKDSMGTKTIIRPGEVQRMSAGSGITHSEYNAMPQDETHFFQIWIMPNAKGGEPGYGQKSFEADLNSKNLVLVVSQDSRDGSIGIKQDADLYISRLKKQEQLEFKVRPTRGVWIQVVQGKITLNETEISTGDAMSFENEELLKIKALDQSEFMIFDLA
ncbi:MAG: quercetin 2,3-dioxygenase [Bdellovibrionales bacterium RIFCSPHIGHO2_01_FULL_40_29]|nr:MAG: quercetin 2,3-dioxygenase [Bdellovibrionales bacterium RIFCSPHIGHO2_01_FULL_40_29]OFZ34290.1 MAG: quercetin 2,3-dioxygenase [Bdellovibrionales bacterium RIFCSPHIGHO2_02_FULL_40_15]